MRAGNTTTGPLRMTSALRSAAHNWQHMIEDPKLACHDHHHAFERVRAQAQISQGRKDLGQTIKKRLDEGK